MYLISIIIAIIIALYLGVHVYRQTNKTEEVVRADLIACGFIVLFALLACPIFSLICAYIVYKEKTIAVRNFIQKTFKRLF